MHASPDIFPVAGCVDQSDRLRLKRQRARVIWLTGVSGAGKSTLANLLERKLHAQGAHTYLLDGDNLRIGLNGDLGFSDADRAESVRRVAEVARLMVDAGLIVITATISPSREARHAARARFATHDFVEVFVDAPLAVAEARDPKGLYARARAGKVSQFTGIASSYEAPLSPEVHLRTAEHGPDRCVDEILQFLAAGFGSNVKVA
jgi:adenylyl-sulfate kinase